MGYIKERYGMNKRNVKGAPGKAAFVTDARTYTVKTLTGLVPVFCR